MVELLRFVTQDRGDGVGITNTVAAVVVVAIIAVDGGSPIKVVEVVDVAFEQAVALFSTLSAVFAMRGLILFASHSVIDFC